MKLDDPRIVFVKLQPKSKVPFGKTRVFGNYSEACEWLAHGFNVGIMCGPANLRVLDVDRSGVKAGLADKAEGIIGRTFVVKTPGKIIEGEERTPGYHFYFQSLYGGNHNFSEGVGELKCDNVYVVAAGSTHPDGGEYEAWNTDEIAELSDEKLKKLLELFSSSLKTEETELVPSPLKKPRAIPDRIDKLITEGAAEGERNLKRWVIVKELTTRGFDPGEILEYVLTFNANCQPAEDEAAVRYHFKWLVDNADKCLADKVSKSWLESIGYGTKREDGKETKERGELASDLLKNELAPIHYWNEPLVTKDSIILVGGKPGSFKSMMILALCYSMGQHKPFLGWFYPTDPKPPKMLLYDLENGQRLIHRRSKYLLGDDTKGSENLRVVYDFDKDNMKKERDFAEGFDIIILDSYRRFLKGKENESETTDSFYSGFLKPLREQSKTVIIMHHFRKVRQDEELSDEYMAELFRGSSDLVAQVDTAFAMFKISEKKLDQGKLGLEFMVSPVKNRLGLMLEKFGIGVLKDDNDQKTTLSYVAPKRMPTKEEVILGILTIGKADRKTILQKFHETMPDVCASTIDKLLKDMVDFGKIIKTEFGSYGCV